MSIGRSAAAVLVLGLSAAMFTGCGSPSYSNLNEVKTALTDAGIPCDQGYSSGAGDVLLCQSPNKPGSEYSLSGAEFDFAFGLGPSQSGANGSFGTGVCSPQALRSIVSNISSAADAIESGFPIQDIFLDSYNDEYDQNVMVGDKWWALKQVGPTWPPLAQSATIIDALGGGQVSTVGEFCGLPKTLEDAVRANR